MTQNLDLDLYDSQANQPIALTPENSDVAAEWVSTTGASTIEGYNESGYINLQYYDPGEYVYTKGAEAIGCAAAPTASLASCPGWESYIDKTASNDPNFETVITGDIYDAHYTIGNYYSWSAATVNSGVDLSENLSNAPSSICPKGWQLPYSGRAPPISMSTSISDNVPVSQNKGYTNLLSAYGWKSWNNRDVYGNPYEDGSSGIANGTLVSITGAPMYFLMSGYIYDGDFYGLNATLFIWSSTVSNAGGAYHLQLNVPNVSPSYLNNWYYGFSVRCVAR